MKGKLRTTSPTSKKARASGRRSRTLTKAVSAEQALLDSEARYRALVEQIPAVTYTAALDKHSTTIYVSPQIKKMLGYTQAEYIANPDIWRRQLHEDDRKRVMRDVLKCHRNRRPLGIEYRMYRKDGRVIWVEDFASMIKKKHGRPTLLQGVMFDITRRKEIEHQLFLTNQRINEVMSTVPVGIAFSDDLSCAHVTGNATMLKQFDAFPQDNISASARARGAYGRKVRYFSHGKKLADADLPLQRAVAENRIIPPMELEVELPSGRRWIAEISGVPLRDAKGSVFGGLVVSVDITDRRRLERELMDVIESKKSQMGQELHDGVGQSMIAIGYLLSAMRDELSSRSVPEAAELEKITQMVSKTARRIHDMARGLFPGELRRGEIADALRELAQHVKEVFSISCRYVGKSDIRLVDGNVASQLYLIAQEAVTNAVKHSRAETIDIRLSQRSGDVVLAVRDNGRGLPVRVPKNKRLGQRIMQYRADMIGAVLEVESVPGKGTTVTCRLPVPDVQRRRTS